MTRRLSIPVLVAIIALSTACGKKGNPLPPLRPVPQRITDFTARRVADRVELAFTVPAVNLDGTTPVEIDHVDIYGLELATPLVPPSASFVTAERYLRARVPVRRMEEPTATPGESDGRSGGASPATPGPSRSTAGAAAPAASVLPGDRAVHTQSFATTQLTGARAMFYVAVPVAGAGKGRPGPASGMLSVPLSALPPAPSQLSATSTETSIVVSWAAGEPGQRFLVFESARTFSPETATALTAQPLTTPEFKTAVTFGQERCFVVRGVKVAGPVTSESAPTPVTCLTPVDRYPPSAPTGLQAIQEGGAVALIWTSPDANDLAGYIVLRGEGAAGTMQPLNRSTATETTYRDTSVRPGASYVYAVIAVDTAGNPSPQSNRELVTIR